MHKAIDVGGGRTRVAPKKTEQKKQPDISPGLQKMLNWAEKADPVVSRNADGATTYRSGGGAAYTARARETAPDDISPELRSMLDWAETAELPGIRESSETGYQNWLGEVDRLTAQAGQDSAARDGVWQEPSAFEDYRRRQGDASFRLRQQAGRYRDFFDSHRDIYGDEAVDDILSRLDRGGKRLKGLDDLLREEGIYRGQFLDQGEFDAYERLSRADAEELKAWNRELDQEIDSLKAQMPAYKDPVFGYSPAEQKKVDELHTAISRKKQTRNQVLARCYELDNQEKLAALEHDQDAKALYEWADAGTFDADSLLRRMLDRLDRGGRPEEDPAAAERIAELYGIDPVSSGSIAQYMNDLTAALGTEPEGGDKQEEAIRALAGMGYDYNRLARYKKTQEDAKRFAEEQEQIRQTAQEHPVLSSGLSVLAAPFQTVDYLDAAARALSPTGDPDDIEHYEPLNVYNMTATNLVSGIRGAVAGQIEERFPDAELLGVNVPSFLYQTGMSMGDSAAQVGLLGGASLLTMGGAAAASQTQDILARGGNNTQALLGGAAAGAAEMLFEKFSVEQLLRPKSVAGWKSLLKETAKQAGTEASEEVFTEIANILSDAAIMGRDSSAELAVREYMRRGKSEEEARQQVFIDQIVQVAEAGVGGALSGAGMGGVTGAFNWALGGGHGSVEAMQYQDDVVGRDDSPRRSAGVGRETDGAPGGRALQQAAREMAETTIPRQTAPDTPFQKGAEGQAAQSGRDGGPSRPALQSAAEVFGENGQKAFAAAWDGQGDPARYYAGFAAWYQAGLTGRDMKQVRGPYTGAVGEAQRIAAYNSGQRDAAASLAKEKAAAPFAKTAGTEAGLVYDAFVAEAVERASAGPIAPGNDRTHGPDGGAACRWQASSADRVEDETVAPYITAETAGRINTVAKALGVRVRFVDSIEDGRANGRYSGSEILIAKDAENPVMQVIGHEITHRVQELAPEQYRVFRQAALENMADSAVLAKLDAYRAQGENILYEQAMDEAAADYAGRLMEDTQVLDRFIERHRTDRTLLEKLRDAFRGLWQKLTGAERRRAQAAEGKLSAALDAAAEQAATLDTPGEENGAPGRRALQTDGAEGQSAGGEVRYSLKEFKDGRRFVDVDTDQALFDGLTTLEMQTAAKKVVMERFRGKVIGGEYTAYVDRMSAKHYAYPANRRMNDTQKQDKMRASPELDNLLAASTFKENVPDDGRHPTATGGLDKLETLFRVNGRIYKADITVLVTDHGRVFYDMTQFNDITGRETGLTQSAAETSNDAAKHSVPQPGGESKPQYSLKGTTITKTYDQLLKENETLRQRLDYWRGQTKTTKEITTDRKSVTAAAKALVQEYGAKLDAGALAERLQGLYDALASGKDSGGEIGPAYAWERAEAIARDIADAAVEEWSLDTEFPGLREKLRDTPITVGHEYDGDIRNENFRREYRGKLKLSSQGPTNVDVVYAGLAESYPGLFPADITHPADQLEQIMEVADSLSAVSAQNPFSGHMEEAVAGITNEIVEGFFDLPQTRATMADRYEAKLDKAVAHGKQRVAETREQYKARLDALRTENRENVKRAIQRERAARERQVKAIKERHARSRKDAAGRRADSRARDRLLHIVRRLENKKLPEANRTLLNEYIGELDTAAKSMTGKTLAKLENLRDWYSEQKSNNPDFIADPHIEKSLARLSKRQIGALSAQEVAELTQALLNIENEIRTQRKLIDSRERRDVYAAGEQAVRDIEASAGSRPTGLWGLIDKGIVTETLSPLREIRRITGYAKDSPLTRVTQELADGQRAMFDYQMKAEKQFAKYTGDKGFVKSFAGPKAKGIQITGQGRDGPVTVTITPAMRASLYLHSLNDQNLRHILDGGITVPDWKLYRKGQIAEAYARGETVKLTPSQVRGITANMTQKERAFAMAAHRYFNVTSKETINAVSEKLKGYSIAQVENYFPIRTDSGFTRADFESIKFDGTIEGMGFLKERIDAANPILLRDMSAELSQSIQMHSKYAGLAIPVRNFNKLWNVTTGQWLDGGAGVDYNGDEGGGTDGLQGAAGENLRGENYGTDTGRAGKNQSGLGKVADWARGNVAEKSAVSTGSARAGDICRSLGVNAAYVRDAALKEHHPGALAVTEGGLVYLSDTLTEEDAKGIAHHEAVHAVKQRGSAAYDAFLDEVGQRLNFGVDALERVVQTITQARFQNDNFFDLTPSQQRTVFDELNAVVWGCYRADASNARAQFQDVFTDYDGYITALSGVMEAEKTAAQAARRFKYEDSVKKAVQRKWGEAGYGYIEKMMSDLQNGHKPTKAWSKAMSKLRSNYAGAVLTLNASVAMKQAASYPTAAAVLGWGPLAKAMKSFGKVDLELIAKYTPLQWYRSKGFSTQELGDMASRNKQLPKLLNWVQGVDLLTTRKLWKASEYYVRGHNKALNQGTDAYYKAVADIYNQVIEETQPNYTTMQRPQLLRSDDNLIANLQMFKTQPFQNFNILYDAAGEFTAAMRRGDKAEIKQARAKAGRAVTSQLAQLAVFAGMGMVWAMFRGKKKKYEDEDGELTLQSAMSALGKDMAGGALSGIPFGSDAWELLSSKLFGESYYGMDAVTVQALSDTIQSLNGMGELIEDTVRSASAGEDIDWRSAGIELDGYLDDISKAAGVPYENVVNLFRACYRQVSVRTLGELQGEYAAMKLTADPQKKSKDYYDLLYKALEQGDLDSYFTIREELPGLLGKDNSDIDGAMKSRYRAAVEKDPDYILSERARDLLGIRPGGTAEKEEGFGADDLDNASHRSFAAQRADRWREAAAKLEGSALYGKLSDADKDKAMNAAWEYAQQTALAEASGGRYTPTAEWIAKAQAAKKRGVQPWEYALYKTAYGTDMAYQALKQGNLTEYKALRGKYMDVLDKAGTSVDASMRGKYEDKLKENPRCTLPQAALDLIGVHPSGSSDSSDSFGADDLERAAYDAYTTQRAETFRGTVEGLEDMPSFRDMDQETRDKLVEAAYTMAHQTALADNSNGQYAPSSKWVRNALDAQEDVGIEAGEFLLWNTAYNMAFSDKDASGKAIKGREKKDKVRAWLLEQEDLTPEQRAYLWGTEYKSAW